MDPLPGESMERLEAALSAWSNEAQSVQRLLLEQLTSANLQMTRLLERLSGVALPEDACERLRETISGWTHDVTRNQEALSTQIAKIAREVEGLSGAVAPEAVAVETVYAAPDSAPLNEAVDALSGTLNAMTEAEHGRLAQLRVLIGELGHREAGMADAVRAQIEALESSLEERQAAIAQLNEALSERDKALDEDNAALETAQQHCASLGEALRAREAELEGARGYIADIEAELETLRANPAQPEDAETMEALCVRAARWQQACAEAEAHAAGLERAHAAFQEESEKTRSDLEAALSAARTAMDQRGRALRELSRELQETRDMLSSAQERASTLEKTAARFGALEAELRDMQKRLKERDEARAAQAPGGRLHAGTAGFESGDTHTPEARDMRQRMVVSAMAGEGGHRKLGEILVDSGAISREQLDAALEEQRHTPGQRIGALLTGLEYTSEDAVAQAVACQLNLPLVHPNTETVETEASRLLHRDLCAWHVCIPMHATGNRIVMAMANPGDDAAVRKIEDMTRRTVSRAVAAPGEILRAIDDVYGQ